MATSQRRLSAILHADVAGFVRLMEGDEDLTVQHLKSAQVEVWRPAIEIAAQASAAPGPGGVPIQQPIEVRQVLSAPDPEV